MAAFRRRLPSATSITPSTLRPNAGVCCPLRRKEGIRSSSASSVSSSWSRSLPDQTLDAVSILSPGTVSRINFTSRPQTGSRMAFPRAWLPPVQLMNQPSIAAGAADGSVSGRISFTVCFWNDWCTFHYLISQRGLIRRSKISLQTGSQIASAFRGAPVDSKDKCTSFS